VVGFAIVKVITGVFLHETFKVAAQDDEILIMQKESGNRTMTAKMHAFFIEADESGDGLVSWEEFENIMAQERVRHWLAALDIEVADLVRLFTLLDDGDGTIGFQELLDGVHQLKGPAKSVDIVTMLLESRKRDRLLHMMDAKLDGLRQQIVLESRRKQIEPTPTTCRDTIWS